MIYVFYAALALFVGSTLSIVLLLRKVPKAQRMPTLELAFRALMAEHRSSNKPPWHPPR